MNAKGGWVYILTNRRNGVLDTGVTAKLIHRTGQHRMGETPGFVKSYNVTMLVYFARHEDVLAAIAREKRSKNGAAPGRRR